MEHAKIPIDHGVGRLVAWRRRDCSDYLLREMHMQRKHRHLRVRRLPFRIIDPYIKGVSQMKRIKVILIAAGMLVGAAAAQAFSIHCERCTCDMNTGICECTGCTITP